MPRALHGLTFDTLNATRPIEIARDFRALVLRGRAFLVILGPTGVGKTAVAIALMHSLLPEVRQSQRYELGLTLVRELHDFRAAGDAMRRCLEPKLLIVDDLPRVADERVIQAVDELMVARDASGLATVIISNVTPRKLATLLSDRALDRIRASGRVEAVTGPSLRRPAEATA